MAERNRKDAPVRDDRDGTEWRAARVRCTINEFKVGLNSAKTRSLGVVKPVAGVDLTAITVNFTGSVSIPGIASQGASAGAGRGRPARTGGVRPTSNQDGFSPLSLVSSSLVSAAPEIWSLVSASPGFRVN